MAKTYKSLETVTWQPAADTMVIEIGSDRYEGSTDFLGAYAESRGLDFYSVDIDPSEAQNRCRSQHIRWQRGLGSEWCKNVLPALGKKISVLYLDNFDYDWNVKETGNWRDIINKQKQQYHDRFGIEMTNQNCQTEHARQMLACLPFMADQAVVMLDDTYTYNECWIGKGGPTVILLLAMGWRIQTVPQGGVILIKG